MRKARVAIAGFGTVGRSVAKSLTTGRARDLELAVIFNRDVGRKKVDWVPPHVTWTERFEDVLSSDVDIVVEVVGGLTPAGEWIRKALTTGKSVVTANKQLVADSGAELEDLARRHGVELAFEAAVAGGIPVIRSIREGLAGDRIHRIAGILNGTCNFILTRMSDGNLTFEDALREAQARGFAESDPADDLSGIDARAKLAILASVGLGRRLSPAEIPARSIAPIKAVDLAWATRLTCAVRQVSWVERQGESVLAWVSPALVPEASPFAATRDGQNVVVINSELTGEISLTGPGAGGEATASAVVSDLLAVLRHTGNGSRLAPLPMEFSRVEGAFTGPWYLRLRTSEELDSEPGFRAILSSSAVAIDRVLQKPGPESEGSAVVMLAPCPLAAVDRLADALWKGLELTERPVCLPFVGSRA